MDLIFQQHNNTILSTQPIPSSSSSSSRYENQKRRDWNTFCQYLSDHHPPLSLVPCSGGHVLGFLRFIDKYGKTKVHHQTCAYFGIADPPKPCSCPLRQAWGSLDALIGRLRAAYEENGGAPETSPFASSSVRIFLREVKKFQAKSRGLSCKKKKKRVNMQIAPSESQSQPPPPPQPQPEEGQSMMANYHNGATR